MTPRNHDEQQHYVIIDFAETFQQDTGLTMTSCRQIIQDTNSIFNGFSYLIKHLFSLIDFAIPCLSITIKGLTVSQRRDIYSEISEIGIHFTKNRYFDDNHNYLTDICISTTDLWSVPNFTTTPELAIYQHRINDFNAFYSRLPHFEIERTTDNGNIIVSLENFLQFKRIFADAVNTYNQQRFINYNNNYIINNIVYMPNKSSNDKIKHQLADLIFDIKDNLTDAIYKEILEKISLISR
jgi:hypothetical protein